MMVYAAARASASILRASEGRPSVGATVDSSKQPCDSLAGSWMSSTSASPDTRTSNMLVFGVSKLAAPVSERTLLTILVDTWGRLGGSLRGHMRPSCGPSLP